MYKWVVCVLMFIGIVLMGCATGNNKIKTPASAVTSSDNDLAAISSLDNDLESIDTSDIDLESIDTSDVDLESIDTSDVDLESIDTPAVDLESIDTSAVDLEAEQQPIDKNDRKRKEKVIYLTFDDGPSANTPAVLDILKSEGVKATFFVTGHHKGYVHLIKREFNEGHAIGAHSYSHKYEIYTSQETFFNDIEKLQSIIEKYTGRRTKLIRFPGGSSNAIHHRYNEDPEFMYNLIKAVRKQGYQYID